MRRPPLGPAWWVLVGAAVISLVVLIVDVRTGGFLLAATTTLGALMRLVLPERYAGAIAVRSRGTDVLLYLLATIALVVVFALVKL